MCLCVMCTHTGVYGLCICHSEMIVVFAVFYLFPPAKRYKQTDAKAGKSVMMTWFILRPDLEPHLRPHTIPRGSLEPTHSYAMPLLYKNMLILLPEAVGKFLLISSCTIFFISARPQFLPLSSLQWHGHHAGWQHDAQQLRV